MVWWNSIEFLAASSLILCFTWWECRDAADSMGVDHEAAIIFNDFVTDLRRAFIHGDASIRLVPCWNNFCSCETRIGFETPCRPARPYAVDFIAIGRDGREVCLSDAHPAWSFLSACAGAKGLALVAADHRVWAEYPA